MSGWCAFEACRVGYELTASFTEALRVFTHVMSDSRAAVDARLSPTANC